MPVTFRAARALQGPLCAGLGLCATRGRAESQSARRVGRGAAGGQAQQRVSPQVSDWKPEKKGHKLRVSPELEDRGFLMI